MEDNYLYKMQRCENNYMDYIRLAGDVRTRNSGKPSKEECVYLQKAAACQSEMANMSVGEEKLFHQRKLKELGQQIQQIVRVLDPDAYRKWENGKNGNTVGSDTPSQKKESDSGDKEEIDTDDWFCEAPVHSFEDVAGMEELKETLRQCVNDTKTAKLRQYLRQPNLHSFFFYGPPGCGKTYVIEAFIHELMEKDYEYLTLDGSKILSKYVGEAEKIVTRLFTLAQESAPCIVFIDEIDGVCKNRSLPNLPEYASSITTSFLTGYNRLQTTEKPIIFIGATNYPAQVDSAMMDRVELIRIPLPDEEMRKHLFMHHLEKLFPLGEDLTWDMIAQKTPSYNARDINRLCGRIISLTEKRLMERFHDEDLAIEALKNGDFRLDLALFEEAIRNYHPTPKDSILEALDQWEKRYREQFGDEEKGSSAVNGQGSGEETKGVSEASGNLTMKHADDVSNPDGPILDTINSVLSYLNDPGGVAGLVINIAKLTGSLVTLTKVLEKWGVLSSKNPIEEDPIMNVNIEPDAPQEKRLKDDPVPDNISPTEFLNNSDFDPDNI